MVDLSRFLFLAGSLPFLVLGTIHAFATPLSREVPKGLSPSDPDLPAAMARSTLKLTGRTDMWSTWVGFNLSHSLGAVAFGAFVVAAGRSSESFAGQAAVVVPLATLVAGVYVGLAVKYWFRTPLIGCAVAFACFLASWILRGFA